MARMMSAPEFTPQNACCNPARLPAGPPHILVVGDEAIDREILVRKLTSMSCECESCTDGHAALNLLADRNFDLVLSDLVMPGMDCMTLLKRMLHLRPDTAMILVTAVADLATAVASLKEGVYDYIVKPFSLEEVAVAVTRALEKRRLVIENREYQRTLESQVAGRTQQLKEALDVVEQTYRSTLMALGTALDSREPDSNGHSLRVTLYTIRLAQELGIDDPQMRIIEQGALLHDIGKIGIPDKLLHKPEKLTEAEWVLMRRHPEIGYRILSGIKFLRGAAQLVLQHQERYDGSGYPGGIRGNLITLGARIFAVADTLDGMTSQRPFQAAISFEEARDEIATLVGTQLDPEIVQVFLKMPLHVWREIRREVSTKTELLRRVQQSE
jgi:putative nucleotidyltransferase with HDIG domain